MVSSASSSACFQLFITLNVLTEYPFPTDILNSLLSRTQTSNGQVMKGAHPQMRLEPGCVSVILHRIKSRVPAISKVTFSGSNGEKTA